MAFKNLQTKINVENLDPMENRVVKLDTDTKPEVEEFRPRYLKEFGQGDYKEVKKTFGALAATDPERSAKHQKDSRFKVSPVLREPLAIEDEERRVIEERVRTRIAAVSEAARLKAHEIGYAEGMKQGHADAFKVAREESAESLVKFDSLITAFENAKHDVFKANEQFLIELVFRVSRMVLLRELKTDPEYIKRLASELIERVGAKENIRIKLSADDMKVAATLKDDLEQKLGALKNLNIEASPQITQGGLELETEWNAVDASVETQLNNIHAALTGTTSG